MVDPRWLDIIEKFEGIDAVRPSINEDRNGQNNTQLSPDATLSNRKKLVLALSGATVVVFLLLFMAT